LKRDLKLLVVKTPIVGRLVLIGYRAGLALSYYKRPLGNLMRWLLSSNELTNFTYDLTPDNTLYLAWFVAGITGKSPGEILGYVNEIEGDIPLKTHIREMTAASEASFAADNAARFGRRIGWYAIARATKPKVIIETGVDKGLGSCVLVAALIKNRLEGHPGRYFGTDINPRAGYLLTGPYAEHGTLLVGDSIASLKTFGESIDLFINDSDHSADYEADEYAVVGEKMSPTGLILGDNAHTNTKLAEFARRTGRRFAFFQENPLDHWYPGGGIGAAWRIEDGRPF
jgi:hypothetical protein